MYDWDLKVFQKLTAMQVYQILMLRQNIFVMEQNCLYGDIDGCDPDALHQLLTVEGELIGYCRLFAPGVVDAAIVVGRVMISEKMRHQGLATQLMEKVIQFALSEWPGVNLIVSAQSHLQKFYERLGFNVISSPYDEDGIEHIKMMLSTKSSL